jgi:hypothetical protein
MIVYNKGDRIKVKGATATVLDARLEKGAEGIVVSAQPGRVEAAFEGIGLVSVSHDIIKKKVRKVEKLVKAKNLKLSDEVNFPGVLEYVKLGNIYRNDYSLEGDEMTVEDINYDSHVYAYNDLVRVRR